jgi:hypothetical protein
LSVGFLALYILNVYVEKIWLQILTSHNIYRCESLCMVSGNWNSDIVMYIFMYPDIIFITISLKIQNCCVWLFVICLK